MDHRGTPEFPGLVLTLVKDKQIHTHSSHINNSNAQSSECIGVIYHVPDELAENVIQELDYRERGGY